MNQFMGWSVVVLVMACSGDPKPMPPNEPDAGISPVIDGGGLPAMEEREEVHSGTRLKLRWNDFDGTRVFAGLFDSQRQEECSLQRWGDGKLYCTPEAEATTVYRDAQCTQPIGKMTQSRNPVDCPDPESPYFMVTRAVDFCTWESVSLHRGTLSAGRTYYRKHAWLPGCVAEQLNGDELLYDLGPEIPRTELVEVSPLPRAGAGRLQFHYGGTPDGARVALSTDDAVLEGECQFARSTDDQAISCLPSAQSSYAYADATCSVVLTPTPRGIYPPFTVCKPAKYAAVNDTSCSANWMLHRTTEQRGERVYYSAPDSCWEETPLPNYEAYFRTTDPVPAARLARVAEPTSTSRIVPVAYSDGHLRKETELLRDTQLGMDCIPTKLRDGTTRCLPTVHGVGQVFSDPECRTLVTIASVGTCREPPPFVVSQFYASCLFDITVYPVGPKYEGGAYQWGASGCEERTDLVLHQIGTPAPLELFAPATLVVDQ